MINIVYLTEKVSAAAAVASALGIDTSNRNADGFFEGIFAGKRNVVVYTNGHIFELKEPEALDARYKVWSLEDLPIRYGMALDDLVAKDDKRILYIKIKNWSRQCSWSAPTLRPPLFTRNTQINTSR